MPDEELISSTVYAVAHKLPSIWPADRQMWFIQLECKFTTRRITADMTKLHHVVTSLSPPIATKVRNLLLAPPTVEASNTLKAQLIRRTSASEKKRLQQLLTAEELGDRTPTNLSRRIEECLGDKPTTIDESLLCELFLRRLLRNIRMVLASAVDGGLANISELTDKIIEVATPSPNISAAHSRSSPD
ncbi:hypothetical protein HPB47_009231 [Ixodes persulcatus]|uniref:Uncharacterized protein n=1 Tax=Ixodes persulcatus TaxID=34615 RepID=A0AC60P2V5_IXOPE|nr:hypothetical protein HPB47_009231 [Ixodes persulcatus]